MLTVLKGLTANNKNLHNIFSPKMRSMLRQRMVIFQLTLSQQWVLPAVNKFWKIADCYVVMNQRGNLSLLALSDAWLKMKLCDNLRYSSTLASMWLCITLASSIPQSTCLVYFRNFYQLELLTILQLGRSRSLPGNNFKHLMMYHDWRFSQHPWFRYFALVSEMHWRETKRGRIYIH